MSTELNLNIILLIKGSMAVVTTGLGCP